MIGRIAFLGADQIDLADRLNRLVNRGDKWHSHLTKFDAVELCHETVTHRFCCNARLIGNKEHGSLNHGSLGCWRISPQSVSLNPPVHKQRTMKPYIIPFEQLKNKDVELVGGKNASIGEMISGIGDASASRCPAGSRRPRMRIATSSRRTGSMSASARVLAALDVDDVERLAVVGAQIRGWMLATPFPKRLHDEILDVLAQNGQGDRRSGGIRRRGPFLGHRRRSAGGILRRAAGDFPERARRGSI